MGPFLSDKLDRRHRLIAPPAVAVTMPVAMAAVIARRAIVAAVTAVIARRTIIARTVVDRTRSNHHGRRTIIDWSRRHHDRRRAIIGRSGRIIRRRTDHHARNADGHANADMGHGCARRQPGGNTECCKPPTFHIRLSKWDVS
ncbi:exported protein of unknown function [Cupriavidus taiwanensis]|nr:exported protein of unknown function [Cupriavidus taiwanensis]